MGWEQATYRSIETFRGSELDGPGHSHDSRVLAAGHYRTGITSDSMIESRDYPSRWLASTIWASFEVGVGY